MYNVLDAAQSAGPATTVAMSDLLPKPPPPKRAIYKPDPLDVADVRSQRSTYSIK